MTSAKVCPGCQRLTMLPSCINCERKTQELMQTQHKAILPPPASRAAAPAAAGGEVVAMRRERDDVVAAHQRMTERCHEVESQLDAAIRENAALRRDLCAHQEEMLAAAAQVRELNEANKAARKQDQQRIEELLAIIDDLEKQKGGQPSPTVSPRGIEMKKSGAPNVVPQQQQQQRAGGVGGGDASPATADEVRRLRRLLKEKTDLLECLAQRAEEADDRVSAAVVELHTAESITKEASRSMERSPAPVEDRSPSQQQHRLRSSYARND